MKEKTIIIEIDEQGNSSIDLQGFQGMGCGDVAKALRGSDIVTKSENKREFYVQATVKPVERRQA